MIWCVVDEATVFDVVIIGAGISGLIAAYELKKAGKSVLVIEKSSIAGGCIRTKVIDGFTLEQGANTLVLTPTIHKLLSELSLLDKVSEPAFQPFKQYVWSTAHHAPREVPRSPVALIKTDLFTFSEKLKLVFGLFKKITVTKDDSIANIFGNLLGTSVVQKALSPALRGIFGGDTSRLKLAAVFQRIADSLNSGGTLFSYAKKLKGNRRKIFHLTNGNNQLALALVDKIDGSIILNSAISQVTKVDSGYEIVVEENNQSTSTKKNIKTSVLLLANSGQSLSSFLHTYFQEQIPTQRFAPITAVHFAQNNKKPILEKAFGILFPIESPFSIIGVLFNSDLFPDTAPNNQSLITVCIGGVDGFDDKNLSDDEVYELCKKDLYSSLQIEPDTLSALSIIRWTQAIPQYEQDFYKLNAELDSIEKKYPGLFCIGVDRGSVGIPDRIDRVLSSVHSSSVFKH